MKNLVAFLILISSFNIFSQNQQNLQTPKNDFWQKIRFGGGLQLGLGNKFTNIGAAPIAVYPLNNIVSVGAGLQFNYLNQKDFYQAYLYGGSLITLINPIKDIQISMEMEQLKVNRTFENPKYKDDFWNTALYIGAGYQTNFAVVGIRYNVLYKENDNLYGQAWLPFVRILF